MLFDREEAPLEPPMRMPGSHLLLALDFDGTIAPIVSNPASAKIDDRMMKLLQEVNGAHVSVALISGRDIEDLYQRTAGLAVYRVGSHGSDCCTPDGHSLWGMEASPIVLDAALVTRLSGARLRVERKKQSVAVHFRDVYSSNRKEALDEFCLWASSHGLEIVNGRCVVEARVPSLDKVGAIRMLVRHTRATHVFYAGDDLTDFAAIRWASRHGTGVFVESSERKPPEDPRIIRVSEVEGLLECITKAVEDSARRSSAGATPGRGSEAIEWA
jgi:trehalose 6-phosphate phosphatase